VINFTDYSYYLALLYLTFTLYTVVWRCFFRFSGISVAKCVCYWKRFECW